MAKKVEEASEQAFRQVGTLIKELKDTIGDISNLSTENKTTLVASINSLDSKITNIYNSYTSFLNTITDSTNSINSYKNEILDIKSYLEGIKTNVISNSNSTLSNKNLVLEKLALIEQLHIEVIQHEATKGDKGDDAYQVAVSEGFIGTKQIWLASLRGNDGTTPQKGVDYFDGEDGVTPDLSPYILKNQAVAMSIAL